MTWAGDQEGSFFVWGLYVKAELSRKAGQTKLIPLRYKAELSRKAGQTKLIPLRYKAELSRKAGQT
ncbi:MAG: hypothetical protein KKG70_16470, partial [Proteobacteria bacterium]|nr:hypothetical protein [Pseudomonadota bacterium]